ncbi:hypothetical protein M2325_001480 [Methanococcus voltae PS]|uniref:Flagellin n=1 Tax=Methanococcus voltae PS TaxID=523842 RepID=A0ABT2EY32_METVO|nr:class III signal peptide-containing protein [Methanococcus voltae]MCS3922770.1 hypothetical protein [Methanococcus voltae PS]
MLQGDTLRRGQISLEMIIITLVVLGSVSILGYTYINGVEETSAILANTSVISGYSVGGPSNSSNIDTEDPNETDDDNDEEDSDETDDEDEYEGEIRIKNCLLDSSNFQATSKYDVVYTIKDGEVVSNDGSAVTTQPEKKGNHYVLYNIEEISVKPLYNKNYQIQVDNKKIPNIQQRSFEAEIDDNEDESTLGIIHVKIFNNGDIILYILPHNFIGELDFDDEDDDEDDD